MVKDGTKISLEESTLKIKVLVVLVSVKLVTKGVTLEGIATGDGKTKHASVWADL